jgi:nucleotide-binding universal stress UspA family protein
MYKALMVPLDGSEFAEEVLPMARALASRTGARLHLVHVISASPAMSVKDPEVDLDWITEARKGTEGYLQGLASTIEEEDGTETAIAALEGRVVPALREYAAAEEVDLVILTTHGSGGVQRWWLGSVADGLVRTARRHLLLVRPWDDTEDRPGGEPRFSKLLVPLDGSELAEKALGPAARLARTFEAGLTLLRVVPAPIELTSIYGMAGVRMESEGYRRRVEEAKSYLDQVAEGLENVEVEAAVMEEQEPADGVMAGAKEAEADLIVLSTRGRGGVARAVIGSVADKVIRSTVLPVLVIPVGDE